MSSADAIARVISDLRHGRAKPLVKDRELFTRAVALASVAP